VTPGTLIVLRPRLAEDKSFQPDHSKPSSPLSVACYNDLESPTLRRSNPSLPRPAAQTYQHSFNSPYRRVYIVTTRIGKIVHETTIQRHCIKRFETICFCLQILYPLVGGKTNLLRQRVELLSKSTQG